MRPLLTGAALLAATAALAQDPLLLLPHAYKLELENDWVKVVRVRYAPHEKLKAHDHTQTAAAYVYLNDGGPVLFKHEYGAVTRPATRAGSFRVYRAVRETHEVDNPNDAASEFVRVEFKTEPLDERTLNGRYHREQPPGASGLEKVQFDNRQLRVTRVLVPAGGRFEALSSAQEPALLLALTAGPQGLEPGRARWLEAGARWSLENAGSVAVELLRFDLKTRPLAP
jgi:hypothetical protein